MSSTVFDPFHQAPVILPGRGASPAPRWATPADLRIPLPPRGRRIAARAPAEPLWREAMRWSFIALSASMVAGEVALALFGP